MDVDWKDVVAAARECLDAAELKEFLDNRDEMVENVRKPGLGLYDVFQVEKSGGRKRWIHEPGPDSKVLQYLLRERMNFRNLTCSYAYQEGKGSIDAMKEAEKRIDDYRYALKLDVKDFFPSIDHTKLLDMVPDRFREAVCEVVRFRYRVNGHVFTNTHGLPLGNSLSGRLSNLYLSDLDRKLLVKTRSHPVFYLRYADDLLFLAPHGPVLDEFHAYVEKQLAGLDLELNWDKTEAIDLEPDRFDYLGYSLKKGEKTLLRDESRRKIIQRLGEAYRHASTDFEQVAAGCKGFIIHSDSELNRLFQ